MNSKVLKWVRDAILVQAIIFAAFALKFTLVLDDMNGWLARWALAMILLAFWGCMKHIEQLGKINGGDDEEE